MALAAQRVQQLSSAATHVTGLLGGPGPPHGPPPHYPPPLRSAVRAECLILCTVVRP